MSTNQQSQSTEGQLREGAILAKHEYAKYVATHQTFLAAQKSADNRQETSLEHSQTHRHGPDICHRLDLDLHNSTSTRHKTRNALDKFTAEDAITDTDNTSLKAVKSTDKHQH